MGDRQVLLNTMEQVVNVQIPAQMVVRFYLPSLCFQDTDCPPELQSLLENEGGTTMPAPAFGEMTPVQCLRSQEFWLLFVTSAITSGCGLTLLNNLAQMVSSTHLASSI